MPQFNSIDEFNEYLEFEQEDAYFHYQGETYVIIEASEDGIACKELSKYRQDDPYALEMLTWTQAKLQGINDPKIRFMVKEV